MMAALRPWLLGVIAAALILAVLYALVPDGKLRGSLRLTGGMVLLLMLLQPLSGWSFPWSGTGAVSIRQEIDRQIRIYQEEGMKEMASIIAQRTAAYISDEGRQLGVVCHPQVETVQQNDIPIPYRVVMDVPYHRSLSEYIARELGITLERQIWQEDAP